MEFLSEVRFRETLKILRGAYDYILIDAPPLGMVVDVSVIAKACDSSVLVIESGVIGYRLAQNVKNQLEKRSVLSWER